MDLAAIAVQAMTRKGQGNGGSEPWPFPPT